MGTSGGPTRFPLPPALQVSVVDAQLHMAVRDQGPGIAPELQDKLFTPYQRLHDRSHPAVQGVGLGLALVATVVQRHGGSLEVDSDTGRGAEFRLVLPRSEHGPEDSEG
mgnify:CR=1 FL=1